MPSESDYKMVTIRGAKDEDQSQRLLMMANKITPMLYPTRGYYTWAAWRVLDMTRTMVPLITLLSKRSFLFYL